jgi:hypothetical protein
MQFKTVLVHTLAPVELLYNKFVLVHTFNEKREEDVTAQLTTLHTKQSLSYIRYLKHGKVTDAVCVNCPTVTLGLVL